MIENLEYDLENLIDHVALTNEPIFIRGNNDQSAVLISETMWEEIQDLFDTLIVDQRIDAIKRGESEANTLEEVIKRIKSNDNSETLD